MSLDLQAKLTLQTQEAEAALDRVEGGLKQVGAAGQKAGASVQDGLGSRGVQHVRAFKGWLDKAALAAAALAAATTGALVSIKAIGDAINVTQAMSPIDNAAIEAANKALGGTVDKLTLMRQLQQTNLTADQFGPAAKAAAFMAKQFGFTKAHMLDAIHNGTLMETQLQALGISTKHLDNEVQRVAMSMGGAGGEVDEVTKSNIKARVTIEAIRKASKGWTADTRQAGDEAARTLAKFKDVSIELGRKILPTLNKIIVAVTRGFVWADELITKIQKKNAALLAQREKELAGFKKLVAEEKKRELLRNNPGLTADDPKMVAAFDKAASKREKAAALAAKKLLAAEAKKKQILVNQKRIREELVRQALEERRQLQEQAKDLVRNINEKIAQVVADQGGSFGELASGLTDILEKSRAFATTSFGRKGMAAAAKVASEFQGRMNVDLMREIELRKKELGLKGRSLHAAKLIAGWMQGGAKDTAEYLDNERTANVELRAGLQLLQGQAKLAGIRKEQNNAMKDIDAFRNSAESIRNGLIARQNELKKGGAESDKSQIPVLDVLIKRLGLTIQRYRAVGIERQRILAIAARHAKIELQIEKTEARRARQAALLAGKRSIEDARAGLASAQNRTNPVEDIRRAGGRQIEDLRAEIQKLKDEARAKVAKLVAGGMDGNSTQKLLDEIQHNNRLIEQAREKLELVQKTTAAQVEGLSLASQLQRNFAVSGVQFAANMATQVKSSFDGLVGSFGDAMSGVIAGAIQGDKDIGANFGKATLDALGNLAVQWGSFFMIQGAGMLASYQPTGAAVLAAGVGLTALGGVLKGTAGLLSPQKSSGGTTGNSQPFQDRIPGTKTDDPKNVRETYILVNDVPWRGRGQARDFSDMIEWTKRGERMTGKRLAGV